MVVIYRFSHAAYVCLMPELSALCMHTAYLIGWPCSGVVGCVRVAILWNNYVWTLVKYELLGVRTTAFYVSFTSHKLNCHVIPSSFSPTSRLIGPASPVSPAIKKGKFYCLIATATASFAGRTTERVTCIRIWHM